MHGLTPLPQLLGKAAEQPGVVSGVVSSRGKRSLMDKSSNTQNAEPERIRASDEVHQRHCNWCEGDRKCRVRNCSRRNLKNGRFSGQPV